MAESSNNARLKEMLSSRYEKYVSYIRIFIGIVLYATALITLAGSHWFITVLIVGFCVIVMYILYSWLILKILTKGVPSARFNFISPLIDISGITVFLRLFFLPGDTVKCAFSLILTIIFYIAYIFFSIVKLNLAVTIFAGLLSSLLSFVLVLAAFFQNWNEIFPVQLFYFPLIPFVSGVVADVLLFLYTRILEDNLITEDMLKSSRRLRMTMEIVEASIFALNDFVTRLDDISKKLFEGARNQATSIDQVTTAVEELQASMEKISSSSELSEKKIKQTVDFSDDGNLIVQRVVKEILGIHDVVDQMGSSLELINDTADQTNLLALNASIEASRSGEENSGFSVVADEIRNLAEQASATAGEIGKLVKQIAYVIFSGSESSKEAGKIFHRINSDLDTYSDFIHELHLSVQEQLKANREVTSAVESISDVTREYTEATDHVKVMIDDIMKEVLKLKTLVEDKTYELSVK